jgi:4-amino-4-deoxy-L-arabinose transferase-like glycosyltransferase
VIQKKLELIIFILILIFAGFLYFFKLNSIPSGIYTDEAVVAYDSYSLINTGSDHYGQKLPISFKFFGSYTPGLFVYLNTIPIKIFGLNNFSIRFISVISMLFQIIFLYLITKLFIKNKSSVINLISVFFIAITPWVVFNARLGYEVTLAQTFFTAAIYFLLVSIKKPNYLLISSFLFSLSVHTAHTQKIITPLIIIFSFLILKIWRYPKKILILSFLIILITQLPNFYLITTKSFWTKTNSINTNYSSFIDNLNYQFFQTISPKTWFNQSPDIDFQHQIPEISLFYFWMIIPIIIGFVKVLLNKTKSIEFKFIIGLLIISLIPGILSGRFMSTQRLIPLLIPFSIFFFIGISQIINFIKNKFILLIMIFSLAFYSLILLCRSYFILLPSLNAFAWNYGADQVAQYIQSNPDKHFIIDNSRDARQYILFLYYLKYNPQKFHQEIGDYWSKNYYQNTISLSNISFSNIEVRPINASDFENINNIVIGDGLTISDSEAKEKCLKTIKKILYPTQKIAYVIYQPDICSKKN